MVIAQYAYAVEINVGAIYRWPVLIVHELTSSLVVLKERSQTDDWLAIQKLI